MVCGSRIHVLHHHRDADQYCNQIDASVKVLVCMLKNFGGKKKKSYSKSENELITDTKMKGSC